tara:strand:- start:477 stop:683 length:207 start_codon:yes stop_codon:yes gene_type:complete
MAKTRLQILMDEFALWYHACKLNKDRDKEPTLGEWVEIKIQQTEDAGELVLMPEELSLIKKLKPNGDS